MNPRRSFAVAALVLSGIVAPVAQALYYYPRLPERVASHFGPSGAADGWMAKDAFVGFYLGLMAFLLLLFAGIAFGIPHLPNDVINLPRKDYWLAPERRAATLAAVRDQMLTMGTSTVLLLVAVMQATFQANVDGSFRLGTVALWLTVAYLAFTAVWTVNLFRRFAR